MPTNYRKMPIYGRCDPFENKETCNFIGGACCTPDNYCDESRFEENLLHQYYPERFDCRCHINNQTLTDGNFGKPAYYYPPGDLNQRALFEGITVTMVVQGDNFLIALKLLLKPIWAI